MENVSLGIVNRNPLNIRYAPANRWLGLCRERPEVKGFCRFTNCVYGYRAAVVLMKNYIRRYGCDTPEKIVTRWAPPSENRTRLYIACVCGRSGLRPDEKISPEGRQIGRLVAAMARQESGVNVSPDYIDDLRRRFNV